MNHPLSQAPLCARADFDSPLGRLTAWATQDGLAALWFEDQAHRVDALTAAHDPQQMHLAATRAWLDAFWAARPLPKVMLDPRGSAFQRSVWRALSAIPHGQTCSYAAVAQAIGAPKAARAVGMAVGRNPISLIVPCHRVIGSDGSLTGYAGGLERKRRLLELEGMAAA